MKAILRSEFIGGQSTTFNYHSFGIDDNDILIFRNECGEIIRLIRGWHDIELCEDDPIKIPDDWVDSLERKRGYCDC